jgi:hypothetical protein
MKVKDLIKELQEADPTGECYVRCDAGAPFFVERKEGYWDGPYHYIEDGKYHISSTHDKVDIQSMDYESWIWDHDGDYSSIEVDTSVYCASAERKKEWLEKFEKISKECKKFKEQCLKEMTFDVLKRLNDDWHIYQDTDKPVGHYNAMYYEKYTPLPGNQTEFARDRLCQGETEVLLESGLFCINPANIHEWVLASPNHQKGYKKNG